MIAVRCLRARRFHANGRVEMRNKTEVFALGGLSKKWVSSNFCIVLTPALINGPDKKYRIALRPKIDGMENLQRPAQAALGISVVYEVFQIRAGWRVEMEASQVADMTFAAARNCRNDLILRRSKFNGPNNNLALYPILFVIYLLWLQHWLKLTLWSVTTSLLMCPSESKFNIVIPFMNTRTCKLRLFLAHTWLRRFQNWFYFQ